MTFNRVINAEQKIRYKIMEKICMCKQIAEKYKYAYSMMQ